MTDVIRFGAPPDARALVEGIRRGLIEAQPQALQGGVWLDVHADPQEP